MLSAREITTTTKQALQASAEWCVLACYASAHEQSRFATSIKRGNPEVDT
jgi:hypothetical protein